MAVRRHTPQHVDPDGPLNAVRDIQTEYVAFVGIAPCLADRVSERAPEGGDLLITVVPSTHAKCERCWHYAPDVGVNPAHPTLCGRCDSNLHGEGEKRLFA